MGSKRRIAKFILPIILKGRIKNQWYVEPFCGGCNSLSQVDGNRMASDIHPELIALWKALQDGWDPPKYINEDDYNRIKKLKSDPALQGFVGFNYSFGSKYFGGYKRYTDSRADPSKLIEVLKGYAGFTHSFGGTYFGTYRRNDDGGGSTKKEGAGSRKLKSNYDNMRYVGARAYLSITEQAKLLKDVKFFNCAYYALNIPDKSTIYCDPPYAGTSKYKTDSFPHKNFWQWCRVQKEEGHTIFVSEYNAPSDFKCVWSMDVKENLRAQGSGRIKTEKLFTL